MFQCFLRYLTVLAIIIFDFGCYTGTAHKAYLEGVSQIQAGQWDAAVASLEAAREQDPDDPEITIALDRACLEAASGHSAAGREALNRGHYSAAHGEFTVALQINPKDPGALDGLRTLDAMDRAENMTQEGLDWEERGHAERAKSAFRTALQIYPDFDPAREHLDRLNTSPGDSKQSSPLMQHISFTFEKAELVYIFRAIAASAGLNILIDDALDVSRKITVDLNDVTVNDALTGLAKTYGIMMVTLNPDTYLMTPDTSENRQRYAEEQVKMFTLRYSDSEKVKTVLAPMLKSSIVLSEDRLNAVVVRTDPEQMKLAEDLILAMDTRESEVMVSLEVMEITRGKLSDLGLSLGDDPQVRLAVGSGLRSSSAPGKLSIQELGDLTSGNLFITMPSLYLDLLKNDDRTKLLAQPKLRILNRVPARLHIGEKVPVKVTTSNYRNTSEETSTYEYRDVGILMEIVPKIISNNELAMDIRLEISSILKEDTAGQPTIGTREITTTLRLRDGETEIIAGLIKDEERTGSTKIPFLGDMPLIGKLFSSTLSKRNQTDIVIALTPTLLDRGASAHVADHIWTGLESRSGRSYRPSYRSGQDAPDSPQGVYSEGVDMIPRPGPQSSVPTADTGNSTGADETIPRVYLDPGIMELTAGETQVISVMIEKAVDVGSVPFYLEYKPEVIEIGEVAEGPFLASDGQATAFMTSNDTAKGRLIVGLSRLGAAEGVSGSGVLVNIQVTGKLPGTCPLHFSHQSVRGPRSMELKSRFEDGSILVIE